jgi:acyl-coenzyme A synthetase/AMP-(fatty) acid ligase
MRVHSPVDAGCRPLMLGRFRRQRRTAPVEGVWNLPLELNFTRDVVERLARDPNRRALTFVDASGIVTRHTFLEIARAATQWAGLLVGQRLQPGDVVLVATAPSPAWPAIVLGALKAGLVVAPVSADVDAEELSRRTASMRASLLVADQAVAPAIEAMQASLMRPIATVYVDEAANLLRDQPLRAPTHPTVPRDAALILASSGTVATPRLVRHTVAHVWAQRLVAEHWLGARDDDLVWCAADTGSAAAVWYGLLGPWSRGSEIVLHDGAFDPDERLNLIEQLHVTVLSQTPEEYRLLGELPGIEGCDLRALREAVSFGERPDPNAASRWLAAFGVVLRNGYAVTETGLVLGEPPGTPRGGAGVPLPGQDLTVMAGGEELPAGEEGELALRGRPPSLFSGYAGADDPSGRDLDPYLTGDRATRDESGIFWLTGRTADAIAGAGYVVGALEVEAALLSHPAVADVAAVQGGGSGRGAKAFVVATARAEPGEQLADALREHARHAAGIRAVPAEIEFVESLPRTPERKLDRAQLRAGELGRKQAEATWPEPARLVVPPPPTLEAEPELPAALEEDPEPEPAAVEPEAEAFPEPEPVELHVVPDPQPEAEPEPEAEEDPSAELTPERPAEPEQEPEEKPQPISAPSQSSGLAARLSAYGRQPKDPDDRRT